MEGNLGQCIASQCELREGQWWVRAQVEKEPSPGLVTGLVCSGRENRELKGSELPPVYKRCKRGLGVYPAETLFTAQAQAMQRL